MTHFDETSRWRGWSKNEFSHGLSLQATRDGRSSSAIAEDVISPACLVCVPKLFSDGEESNRELPQPAVNNFAAAASKKIFSKPLRPGKVPPGRIAPRRSRSDVPKPARLQLRTPVGAAARPQTSERTEPCEGPYTRMTPGQPTMPRKEPMKTYSQLSHFGGLDWAKHHHDVCIP